jgi:hypothetical protein
MYNNTNQVTLPPAGDSAHLAHQIFLFCAIRVIRLIRDSEKKHFQDKKDSHDTNAFM